MRKSYYVFAIFSLILTACSSKPVSYLPSKSDPIVNIEANIAQQIKLTAKTNEFSLVNLSNEPLDVEYKLFWYDENGVTQTLEQSTESSLWQRLGMLAKQQQSIHLRKPSEESLNYRLYLRRAK